MLRTIPLLFAATLMFTATACDSTEEPVEDRAAQTPESDPGDPGDPGEVAAKRGHHGKHNPTEKLCAELECSDAQVAQIDALFAKRHDGRDDAKQAHKAARAEAHEAIADAFRAEEFDVSVLARVMPEPDHDGDHQSKMIAFATELHAILTPEQRAKLADQIEAGHPMLMHHGKWGGHHGKGGKHGKWGKHDKQAGDHEDRLAQKVDRFCEPISCSPEQATKLTATFQGAHEAKREAAAKPNLKPLADALRGETLDEGKLRAALAESGVDKQERKADHLEQMGAMLAEIHDILTPEQRAIVADKIEAEGLHALMGKGHGKHGKKHGKRKHHRGPEAVAAE